MKILKENLNIYKNKQVFCVLWVGKYKFLHLSYPFFFIKPNGLAKISSLSNELIN